VAAPLAHARTKPLARTLPERLVAWLYTGPLGHLYGAVADIAVLWLRWALGRARERIRR
jgi:hypothetical protein